MFERSAVVPLCERLKYKTVARTVLAMLACAAILSGCRDKGAESQQERPQKAAAPGPGGTGAKPADFMNDDGQWTIPAKDFASTRYSSLDQINTGNVGSLKVAWTFSTSVLKGHEAAPLVVGDTMYVVTPFPNILYALDLNKPGTMKWKYDPQPTPSAQGVACCDVVNRGASFYNGRIYYATLDDQVVAVDAKTGNQVWKTKVGDINTGESITMAVLVVKGKVLVGNSGGEMGVRGWLKALDAESGKVLWTAYSTGPDKDVLIGPNFHPHYDTDKGKDLGVTTWPPDAWKIGGGTVWGWISYDPEQDLIIYGVANPGPWNPDVRPGDNKWTAGVFARKLETGEAIWYYQYNHHDLYDYDGVNEHVLIDMPVNGKMRKVLLHPDRNGRMYVLDRTTGEVLSANPFVHLTTTSGVDMKTGRVQDVEQYRTRFGAVVRGICPAASGGKDWQPSSFSPQTGMLYIPHQNLCQDEEGVAANYIAGTPYVGANVKMYFGPGGYGGELSGWDPVKGAEVWKITEQFPVWSGTVATAGGLVFYGTMDGYFKAVDARSGKELWKFKTGSGVIGQPVTYKGPDGKQYVAVLAGVGGWAGAIVAGGLDSRDGTAALGFVNAMKDLPKYTGRGGELYVFSLP